MPKVETVALVDCSLPPPKTPMIYLIFGRLVLAVTISIEPHHLTNQSNPHAPWATKMWLIVEYYIHHIIINIHDDGDVMGET
jgi:hypothetical protein